MKKGQISVNLLHLAAEQGNATAVKEILMAQPEQGYNNLNVLHLAVARGHVEVVKVLFKEAPEIAKQVVQNSKEWNGYNAMHLTAFSLRKHLNWPKNSLRRL